MIHNINVATRWPVPDPSISQCSLSLWGCHVGTTAFYNILLFSGFCTCLGVRCKHILCVHCPVYLLIQSHAHCCHSEPAGCQGGEIWKPGWDVDFSKHPKTPVSSPAWRSPAQLCRMAGGRHWALWGWCGLGGAKCMVPHFSRKRPNSQLHTPVPLQHQSISSSLGNAGFAWRGQE